MQFTIPNEKKIEVVSTMAIDEAMEEVLAFVDSDYSILVVVEDARLGSFSKEKICKPNNKELVQLREMLKFGKTF